MTAAAPAAADWALAVDLWIAGVPAPQGSARVGRAGGRPGGRPIVLKDNAPAQTAWRHAITATVLRHYRRRPRPLTGPVLVDLAFVMPRPVHTPRTTPPAVKKPDGDKLERCTWDGLTQAGIWSDDAQVVAWSGSKRLAEPDEHPGCRVRVYTPAVESS